LAWVHAELLGEEAATFPARRKCVCLAVRTEQGDHQGRAQPFSVRLLSYQ
jgi:hypothetical protein